ncbi:MAG: hypothetical protein PW843_25790 [Azospirillaceae bacterium]|nr:hypothetical protein [Azospirillaceae bacterium]
MLFAHTLIGFDLGARPHRGVRLVRDPRDIWLSGYLYHRRCDEAWCTNTDFSRQAPIRFPQVPHSRQHCAEDWKRSYLAGLGGRSYQQNLMALDRDAGLAFELDRYTGWTLEAMAAWRPDPDTIDVRMEDFMADFDGTLTRIVRHCGMEEAMIPAALAVATSGAVAPSLDMNRMSDAQVASDPHIHSRSITKWPDLLSPAQMAMVEDRHGALIQALGYPVGSHPQRCAGGGRARR